MNIKTKQRTWFDVKEVKRIVLNTVFLDLYFNNGTSKCIKEKDVIL